MDVLCPDVCLDVLWMFCGCLVSRCVLLLLPCVVQTTADLLGTKERVDSADKVVPYKISSIGTDIISIVVK